MKGYILLYESKHERQIHPKLNHKKFAQKSKINLCNSW